MSKFIKFILFNTFMYIIYTIVDKLFTLLDLYSNPELGINIMVMPTNVDIWLIVSNSILSSIGSFYLILKMKDYT